MRFTCHKHGEVEAEPNLNRDAYCPLCLRETVEDGLDDTVPPLSWARDVSAGPDLGSGALES